MEKLFNLFRENGWSGQIVPIEHLEDLRHSILDLLDKGLLDAELYNDQLSFFSFEQPAELPGARSIIIVAVPTPQMRVIFRWKNRDIPLIVPPTYVSYTPRTDKVQKILSVWLEREGYKLAKPQLPLKTLAVRSGLAKYGRNNICYVEGMGSFLQLIAAFSNLPCNIDPWQRPEKLDRCESCIACLRHCPTKAISKNRFLLYAETCLTYHNESSKNFPDWIDPSWHHCLIGCMQCQEICPENKSMIDWIEDRSEFSEYETELFIKGVPFDKLPRNMVNKFKKLEINESYQNLSRNLSIVVSMK